MLKAFFDESGHSSATEFFAIGAFVAPDADWPSFEERWHVALRTYGAPYLHMREFAHTIGAFDGWPEVQRRRLLAACVAAINSIPAIAVGAAISVEDFKNLDAAARSRLQDPFFCCFQEVVRGAALNAHLEAVGAQVNMLFSRQDEFGPMARRLWDVMAESIDAKERMGRLEFRDMRTVPGLQAADLLAYEFRHFYHLRKTRPDLKPRWAFREIVQHQRLAHGGHMLKYLPAWYLRLQGALVFDEAMAVISRYPTILLPLLAEMFPGPIE